MVFKSSEKYQQRILKHYIAVWDGKFSVLKWDRGAITKLPSKFEVLEFPPTAERNTWIYATCCMSQPIDQVKIELHMYSGVQDRALVELLTAVVYYHSLTHYLNLNHTVNFGKSWQGDSKCSYGFISLPYLEGPMLENIEIDGGEILKFYWLIPVTEQEVEYKTAFGVEALESKMEEGEFNYIDPYRLSVV